MKYYLWILGCAMNYSDAERLAYVLESLGYHRTKKETEADLIVVLACSVRQSAIDRIYGKAKIWKKLKANNPNLKTILTGCVLPKDKPKMEKIFDVIFSIEEINKLPQFLNNKIQITNNKQTPNSKSQKSKQASYLENSDLFGDWDLKIGASENYFRLKPKYESNFRAYVPIMTGCNNFCTYCAVPYVRGREKSRPKEDIITEVKDLVKNGYKEITLLGQNVNSYGTNNNKQITNNKKFVELLKQIDKIPGDYRVYFYSNHPKDMSDELVNTLSKLKHFPNYLHLPLQSGNDEVLARMNRHYTQKEYLDLVKKIRKTMPDVALTTDIIVGFPTETKNQFKDTKNVMEKAGFDMAFLAQYSPREGTIAAKMTDNVPKAEKVRREKVLQKTLAKTVLINNNKMVGKTVKILIDEKKGDKFYGRTEGYKVTEIHFCHPERAKRVEGSQKIVTASPRNDKLKVGQFIDVKITKAESWKLIGEIV